MRCNFSFKHYREILETAKKQGYFFTTLKDFDRNRGKTPIIIMRHDIDHAPIRALELAKIEKEFNIQSTFFVRLHAKDYNPFNFRIYSIFKKIAELGHEIGLHSEVMDFAAISNEEAVESFNKEKKVFRALFGNIKFGVSSHNDYTPINNLDFWRIKRYHDPDILYEAYDAKFFEDSEYIRDNLCRWTSDKCACKHIDEKHKVIYLLTHPLHWYKKSFHLEE